MEKLVLCFPGQGAQKPKMALDLYSYSSKVRDLFSLASDLTHLDLKKILEESDAKALSNTRIAQSTIILAERSVAIILEELGYEFSSVAGFSLGELSAYRTSGVISEEELFTLISIRGQLMDKAANSEKKEELSMAAIIGMNKEKFEIIMKENNISNLYLANDNSSNQIVLSGYKKEIKNIEPLLKASGARRVVELKVASAFHSPFMKEAEVEFAKVLDTYNFKDPNIALYCNVTGDKEVSGSTIKNLASQQITQCVNWRAIMKKISKDFEGTRIVEAGPGKVLSGLFKTEGVVCTPSGTLEQIMELRN